MTVILGDMLYRMIPLIAPKVQFKKFQIYNLLITEAYRCAVRNYV